jgi:hypothetical protein
MSLLTKVLKLAQELDRKGLPEEASILDELAASLPSPEDVGDEHDRIDPDAYMEMFRELFLHNNTEGGMEPTEAARAAVNSVSNL